MIAGANHAAAQPPAEPALLRCGPFGVFGGMFDPIHYGHLRTAHELFELLDLEAIAFVPAGDPPHRAAPLADGATRLAMLRAAVEGDARFLVDDRELRRSGPSYTVLTLEELRAERGAQPIVLIMGMDAFAGLDSWHRAADLLGLAHIVVAVRPGSQPPRGGLRGRAAARSRLRRSAPAVRDARRGSSTSTWAPSLTCPRAPCATSSPRAAIRAT